MLYFKVYGRNPNVHLFAFIAGSLVISSRKTSSKSTTGGMTSLAYSYQFGCGLQVVALSTKLLSTGCG